MKGTQYHKLTKNKITSYKPYINTTRTIMDIHPTNTQDKVSIDQSIFNNIQINSFRQMVDNGLVSKRVAEIQKKNIYIQYESKKDRLQEKTE